MKQIIIILAITLGFFSCNPLGIEPTDKVFEEQFWDNPQLTRSFVNYFYLWQPAAADSYHRSEQWSDNAIGNNHPDQNSFRQGVLTNRLYDELNSSGSAFSAPWGDLYKLIRSTNLGIEKIPNVSGMTPESRDQMLAECHFFRAIFYIELEKYWGGVPYIGTSLTVNDETLLPRDSREFLFDKILADLDKAAELFTASGETPLRGLANLDIVNSMKSRAALYAACAAEAHENGTYANLSGTAEEKAIYAFDKSSDVYYQMAYDAGKKVLGKYTLEAEYNDLFSSPIAHQSTESIWPVMFNYDNRSGFNPGAWSVPRSSYYGNSTDVDHGWGAVGGAYPTQDLVDCYYQKDDVDGKWKKWSETSQAKAVGSIDSDGNYIGSVDAYASLMFENRDSRFYTTIQYDSSYYGGKKELKYLIATWIDNSVPSNSEQYSSLHTAYSGSLVNVDGSFSQPGAYSSCNTMTGYYANKYTPKVIVYNENGTVKFDQTSNTMFMMRYAEVLMNLAEAAYKLNKPAETEEYVNMIRNRAGIGSFDASTSGHNIWVEYKLQRRVEFAFEIPSHRYFDLLRWGESDGLSTIEEINRYPKGMFIFRKGVDSEEIGIKGLPVEKGEVGYYTPEIEVRDIEYAPYEKRFDSARFYKMPFSQSTLEANTSLSQNLGWTGYSYM